MDGTKRKARSSSFSVIDLGASPPWSLPSIRYPESALRSTQAPDRQPTARAAGQPQNPVGPTAAPPGSPLNTNPNLIPIPQGRSRIGKPSLENNRERRVETEKEAEEDEEAEAEEDEEVHVDTENDAVYMFNVKEGSWSGTLPSEDDPEVQAAIPYQAELALMHLKRAQEFAKREQQLRAANTAMQALLTERNDMDAALSEKVKWQKDLLLRNTMRQIKRMLQQGAVLTLERMEPVNLTWTCTHPHCATPDKLIPGGAYYISLHQPFGSNLAVYYCLCCLEELWDGTGMASMPDPEVISQDRPPKQKIPSFTLDGAMDEDRLAATGLGFTEAVTSPGAFVQTPSSISRFTPSSAVSTPPIPYSSHLFQDSKSSNEEGHEALDAISDSPLLHKSQAARPLWRGDQEDTLGSQTPLIDKLKKASGKSKRKVSDTLPLRRSSRLHSMPASNGSAPSALTNGSGLSKDRNLPQYTRPAKFVSTECLRKSEYVDRWCLCHCIEDGRKMIQCDNEKCLVGWYHTDCIGAEVDEDGDQRFAPSIRYHDIADTSFPEEWLCPLCVSQQSGNGVMPSLPAEFERLKGLLDAPFADQAIYDLEVSWVDEHKQPEELDDGEQVAHLLHLDGASDPPQPSPPSQTPYQIPKSLLSSKHAPPAEARSTNAETEAHEKPPSPPLISVPATPRVSESPEGSTNSTGEWRHPPTRFQHLAKFIRPGDSLTAREKAAVEVWKAASEEQLWWNGFRETYERTVRELLGPKEDEEGDFDVVGDESNVTQQLTSGGVLDDDKIYELGVGEGEGEGRPQSSKRHGPVLEESRGLGQEMENISGLTKRDCYGKILTAVLAHIRSVVIE